MSDDFYRNSDNSRDGYRSQQENNSNGNRPNRPRFNRGNAKVAIITTHETKEATVHAIMQTILDLIRIEKKVAIVHATIKTKVAINNAATIVGMVASHATAKTTDRTMVVDIVKMEAAIAHATTNKALVTKMKVATAEVTNKVAVGIVHNKALAVTIVPQVATIVSHNAAQATTHMPNIHKKSA